MLALVIDVPILHTHWCSKYGFLITWLLS